MILQIIILITLLIAAGFFKGRLDAIADEEIKNLEWDKKYDLTKPGETKHWWYFGLYTPKFPEKFPFSATALVFLTDRWHFNQFMMLKCFQGAIAFLITGDIFTWFLLTFIILPSINGIIFEMTYENYRKKLRKKYKQKLDYTSQGDEPQQEQITSIPEKQIEDEIH
jgi:hypothetical protein